MAKGPLGLTDAQFWTDPHRTEDALIDRLMDEGWAGVLLDGPARVDLRRRESLPLHGVWAATYRDLRFIEFDRQALLVVVRLESNQVFVRRAFELKQPARKRAPDERKPPEGTVLRSFHVEARARIPELPWRAGTLLVTLVVQDRVSNRVRVALQSAAGSLAGDPAVKAFIAAADRRPWPQPVFPRVTGQPLPSYARGEATPPVPAGGGLALAVDRLHTLDAAGGGQVVVRGSFRLPLLPRYVVRPPEPPAPASPTPAPAPAGEDAPPPAPPEEDPGSPDEGGLTEEAERDLRLATARAEEERGLGLVFQDPGDRKARAVVPVTLLVATVERADPVVVPLQVPVYDPFDPAAAEVEGQFAVDLLDLVPHRALLGPSFVFAVSGEALAGPVPTSVVREDQLRPRQGG